MHVLYVGFQALKYWNFLKKYYIIHIGRKYPGLQSMSINSGDWWHFDVFIGKYISNIFVPKVVWNENSITSGWCSIYVSGEFFSLYYFYFQLKSCQEPFYNLIGRRKGSILEYHTRNLEGYYIWMSFWSFCIKLRRKSTLCSFWYGSDILCIFYLSEAMVFSKPLIPDILYIAKKMLLLKPVQLQQKMRILNYSIS